MCGIAGIINISGGDSARGAVSAEKLRLMAAAIAHRGPDGEGFYLSKDSRIGLAHRRLSIIDVSASAAQPMERPDLGLTIVFNGEIYNYIELRDELSLEGYKFSTSSDTEVILCAYDRWGISMLPRFNGMWAIALHDRRSGKVLMARDRFGVKPIYFSINDGVMSFASEIKALSKIMRLRPNMRRIGHFYDNGRMPDRGETFFEGVYAFPQAHFMTVDLAAETYSFGRYWEYDREKALSQYDFSDPVGTFRELFESAVKLRLRSDVPVGTCLSGGLDSSAIVSVMSKKFDARVLTFSSVYDEADCNEKKYIDAVCDDCSTEAREIRPAASEIPDVLDKMAYFQDEPAYGPGLVSQWFVMRLAQPYVKVLLDGQGADEILGGYSYFYADHIISLFNAYMNSGTGLFNPRKIAAILAAVRDASANISPKTLLGTLLLKSTAFARGYKKFRGDHHIFTKEFEKRRQNENCFDFSDLFGGRSSFPGSSGCSSTPAVPAVSGRSNTFIPPAARLKGELPSYLSEIIAKMPDNLSAALLYSLTVSSIPPLLRYEERNSMAFSIESRTPFLDYRLAEFSLSLPSALKFRGLETKAVLRDAMAGTVCPEVLARRDKMGFPAPFYKWIKKECRDYISDLLLSEKFGSRNIIKPEYAASILREHNESRRDRSWEIWRLASVENWFRKFIDRP